MVLVKLKPEPIFWGLHLEPGKCYTQVPSYSLRITMAALDSSRPLAAEEQVRLYFVHKSNRYLLCTLSSKLPQQPLNLQFSEEEELRLVAEGGDTLVHLTGHVVPPQSLEELPNVDVALSKSGERRKRLRESPDDGWRAKIARLEQRLRDGEEDDSEEDEDYEVDSDEEFEEDSDEDSDEDYIEDMEELMRKLEEDDSEDTDEEEEEEEEDMDEEEEAERKRPLTALDRSNGLGKKGKQGKATPGKATPGKATPGKATPGKAKATPGQTKAKATPGKKDKTPSAPATPASKPKHKNSATPGGSETPASLNTSQNSEAEGSKKKKKRKNKKKKNKSDSPSVSEPSSSTPQPQTSQQQQQPTPKAKQQQQQAGKGQTPGKKRVLAGGTTVEEVRVGQGPEAKPGRKVEVYYRGFLTSGKQFDSKTEGKPLKFRLGAGEVIKGWDMGLQGMKVGGKRKITIPPSQGYGNSRQGPIPPGSILNFEVELKNVT